MRELSINERAYIDSQLEAGDETLQTSFAQLAFKYRYTLSEIAVRTGWAEGYLFDVILSANDPRT